MHLFDRGTVSERQDYDERHRFLEREAIQRRLTPLADAGYTLPETLSAVGDRAMIIKVPVSPNDEKFIELLLYIARRSEDDGHFGAVKLNKLMFYSDFYAYQLTGKSITGHTYKKLPNGPAPKAMVPILNKLKQSGAIREETRQRFNRVQKRVVAIREPDVSVFTAKEISLVDSVLSDLKDGNATDVSDWSHEFIGWKAAALGEDIPYQTALISGEPEANEVDIAFAESLKPVAARLLAGR